MFGGWKQGILFWIYALITLGFVGYYLYFLLFQKKKHKQDTELDNIPDSLMLTRPSKEWGIQLVHPIEEFLVRKKIAPVHISWTSVFFALLACIFYSFGGFVLGGWAVVLSGFCDMLDGRVARRLRMTSQKGEFLDSNLDRLSECLWFLGLFNFYANTLFFYVVFVAFTGSLMVSYSKARAEGLDVRGRVGMMQRSERIVWIGVTSILSPLFSAVSNYLLPISTTFLASIGISVVAILSCYTYYQRFQHTYKNLS